MKNKVILFFVVVLCLISSLVPITSAFADSPGIVKHATPEQLATTNSLHGTSITFGEFLKQVFPDEYEKAIKSDSKENLDYLNSIMEWSDMPAPDMKNLSARSSDISKVNKGLPIHYHDSSKLDIVITHVQTAEEDPVAFTGSIYHLGRIWTEWWPISMPQLSAFSFLNFWNGSSWTTVDIVYSTGAGVQYMVAADFHNTTSHGYYYTNGAFTFTSPPGGNPSSGILYEADNDSVYLEP